MPDIGLRESESFQPCFHAFESGEENRTKYEFALIRIYSPRYDKGHIVKKPMVGNCGIIFHELSGYLNFK